MENEVARERCHPGGRGSCWPQAGLRPDTDRIDHHRPHAGQAEGWRTLTPQASISFLNRKISRGATTARQVFGRVAPGHGRDRDRWSGRAGSVRCTIRGAFIGVSRRPAL